MILTTNLPDVLDKALKDRSSAHWITFPTPTGDDRQQLLKWKLGTILQRREFQSIAAATAGYSPRSIVELIRSAVIEAISLDCPLTKDLLLRAASSGGLTQAFQSNGRGFYRRTPSPGSRKRRPKHAPAQRHKSVYATAVE
jgi:hypothetical protein